MPKNRSRVGRLASIALLLGALIAIFSIQNGSALAASSRNAAHSVSHALKQSTGRKEPHAATGTPAQGMFDTCALSQSLITCEQHLTQMHQAGMQVAVISILGDSLPEIQSYANYAQSSGMSVMWAINDPGYWGGAWIGSGAATDWTQFSSACGCSGNTQVLDYMIRWLQALPATYGYYAADDSLLTPGQVAGLKQYVNEIKSVDPSDMVMVGSNQDQGTTYFSTGATVGNEIYPETTNSLLPYGHNLATWASVQQSVTDDQRAATHAGTPSAFILQAFSFGDSLGDGEAAGACTAKMTQPQCASLLRYPEGGVQLELRNQVLEHSHPKLILWFTFRPGQPGKSLGRPYTCGQRNGPGDRERRACQAHPQGCSQAACTAAPAPRAAAPQRPRVLRLNGYSIHTAVPIPTSGFSFRMSASLSRMQP